MSAVFAKRFFCRKLYVAQGRCRPECGAKPLKNKCCTNAAEGNFDDEDAAGDHGTKQHSGMSGASCSFVRKYAEIKAVVQAYHSLFCLSESEREGLDYGS